MSPLLQIATASYPYPCQKPQAHLNTKTTQREERTKKEEARCVLRIAGWNHF
jgi:hypothetical protein